MSHDGLAPILETLRTGGLDEIPGVDRDLTAYLDALAAVDPDRLTAGDALAYWLNLYNAAALRLTADAVRADTGSVLRVPGAFDRPAVRVGDAILSLNEVEHGKLRRLGDPRIHFAVVCGSVSCPTLRFEPFAGERVDEQLEDQARVFFRSGGAERTRHDAVLVSRILLWYGGDFTRPHRMPTWLPPRRQRLLRTIRHWLPVEIVDGLPDRPRLGFLDYDWALGCTIA